MLSDMGRVYPLQQGGNREAAGMVQKLSYRANLVEYAGSDSAALQSPILSCPNPLESVLSSWRPSIRSHLVKRPRFRSSWRGVADRGGRWQPSLFTCGPPRPKACTSRPAPWPRRSPPRWPTATGKARRKPWLVEIGHRFAGCRRLRSGTAASGDGGRQHDRPSSPPFSPAPKSISAPCGWSSRCACRGDDRFSYLEMGFASLYRNIAALIAAIAARPPWPSWSSGLSWPRRRAHRTTDLTWLPSPPRSRATRS